MNDAFSPRTEATAALRIRLYVAGQLPNSLAAIANLQRLCSAPGFARCDIEIVDVMREPLRPLEDHVITTPTLVRISPAPTVRISGTLANLEEIRALLVPPSHNWKQHGA